ncbi:MAG: carboxypeptidase regulatory-like domain-containing protein, partial [Bacteroidetes bacterium]|nr:carboxypeptidase regulatory-like domain-containing protein [Bacteroidota bacterium]
SGQVTDTYQNGIANATLTLNGNVFYTDDAGTFNIELIPGTYNLSVTADGFIGYQDASLELFEDTALNMALEALLFPPLHLTGEVVDQSVLLQWDAPASEGEWMYWDDGENSDAVGGENIDMFDAAIRFTTNDLQNFDGFYLTKIVAFFGDVDATFQMRVWTGGNQYFAGNLVTDQLVTDPVANEWNTIELENPVLVDATQELWMGYRIINTGNGYPAGTDNGPAVPFKGDMILYGSDWLSMSDYFGWNINWNIRGFLVEAPGERQETQILDNSIPQNSGLPEKISLENQGKTFRWNYTHFNVWRNFMLLAEVPADELSFLDEQPMNENTYVVTTARDMYESPPSNEVTIELVGVDDNQQLKQPVRFYPNPIKASVQLQFNSKVSDELLMEISDQQGRLLHKQTIDAKAGNNTVLLHRNDLQLNNFKGIIIIKLQGKHLQSSTKLILE